MAATSSSPTAAVCGGRLKPDVVFFGESVPGTRVERAYALVDAAEVLVVLGSSLTVMSGLRFVRHSAKHGRPVVIINRGPTRGDELATIKIDGGLLGDGLDAADGSTQVSWRPA